MKRLFISMGGLGIGIASLAAGAAPSTHAFPVPQLKKGIWAITYDKDLKGEGPQHIPERNTSYCLDLTESIRRDLVTMEKAGCSVELHGSAGKLSVHMSNCPPHPGARTEVQTDIQSSTPEDVKVTNVYPESGRVVMAGRWVKDCPPEGQNDATEK